MRNGSIKGGKITRSRQVKGVDIIKHGSLLDLGNKKTV